MNQFRPSAKEAVCQQGQGAQAFTIVVIQARAGGTPLGGGCSF